MRSAFVSTNEPRPGAPYILQSGGHSKWEFFSLESPRPCCTQSRGIAVGSDQNIWFTDPADTVVGRVTMAGVLTEYLMPNNLEEPQRITSGPDGALWVTVIGGSGAPDEIARVTTGDSVTEYPIPTPSSVPVGIAVGSDKNIWFAEAGANKIGKITTAGSFTEYSLPNGVIEPVDVTKGPDGNIWFTSYSYVGKISSHGVVTAFQVPTANSNPYDIVAGKDGALWFTENSANQIGRVTTAGEFQEFPIPFFEQTGPLGITKGPDGRIWFAVGNLIATIDANNNMNGFKTAVDGDELASGPDGNLWFSTGTSKMGVFLRDKMSLSPTDLTLNVGQTMDVTVTESGRRHTWTATSSDTAVATVVGAGQGQFAVTGVASGVCQVTVTDDQLNSIIEDVRVN